MPVESNGEKRLNSGTRTIAEKTISSQWSLRLSIGAVLLIAIVGSPDAQHRLNLTKAQEGRVEVARCYARCMASAEPMTGARIAMDALDGEWSVETFRYVTCLNDQATAQRQDACSAGCKDIEASYGVRSSHIRTRYYWHLNRSLRNIRASGLWTAWNRFPDPGTSAFIRACSRYVSLIENRIAQGAAKLKTLEPESAETLEARRQAVIANEHFPEPPSVWEGWE